MYEVKQATLTVEKKPLVLVILNFGSISLQTMTKKKKSLKNILVVNILVTCSKLQIVFKNRPDWVMTFTSKIGFPKILLLVSFVSLTQWTLQLDLL